MKSIQNKQLIGIMGIFLFLLMGTIQLHGQSYDQSLLINKIWVCKIPGKTYYMTNRYTDKEEISNLFVDGVKDAVKIKSFYYLSDEVVDKFQLNLVGKSKSGKYIVALRKPKIGDERLELYEILELTDTTLKTKHLRSGTILEYTAE